MSLYWFLKYYNSRGCDEKKSVIINPHENFICFFECTDTTRHNYLLTACESSGKRMILDGYQPINRLAVTLT